MKLLFLFLILGSSLHCESLQQRVKTNLQMHSKEKKECLSYLMPENHLAKQTLEKFFRMDILKSLDALQEAGFTIISDLPDRKIIVVTHPELTNYVLKLFINNHPVNKSDLPDWKSLVRRCELSKKIRTFIKKRKLKYFIAAEKWLYPLPKESRGQTNFWVLVAEKINGYPALENQQLWKDNMQKIN